MITISTPLSRLKELKEKSKHTPKAHLLRWCPGGACACLGCANMLFKTKSEWKDFTAWLQAGEPNHTDIELFNTKTDQT